MGYSVKLLRGGLLSGVLGVGRLGKELGLTLYSALAVYTGISRDEGFA